MSFAVYEMLRENPEMQGYEYISEGKVKKLDFVFNASSDENDVVENYNGALMVAKDLGTDIKKYTDILDVGKTYVAENYFWKSAGFFWMSNKIGQRIEGVTVEEGMIKSTEKINPNEKEESWDIYQKRLGKIKYIKDVSNILEGMQ